MRRGVQAARRYGPGVRSRVVPGSARHRTKGAARHAVGRRELAALIACLAAVTALAIAVIAEPGPLPGELGLVRQTQRLGQPWPALASLVRLSTGTEACLLAALPVTVWLGRRYGRAAAPAIVVALASMLVVQPVTKEIVDRPRPSERLVDVRADYSSESFPSGHSLSTTTTWGAASAYAWRAGRRRWALLLAAPVLLTAASSAIEGVHWASDALAGTLLGGIAAWLIVRSLGVSRGGRRPSPSTS